MKIQFAGLFLLSSLFLLSACGQKGPLYLKKEPAPASASADGEKTADESKAGSADVDNKDEKK